MSLYHPTKISDLFYNKDSAEKLKVAVKSRQPALIYGSAGVGKNSSVYAVCSELGYGLSEINGSDDRSKEKLDQLLIRAKLRSLSDQEFVIFIDEADGLTAWSAIEKILTISRHPVILAANEIWSIPDSVKNRCTQIKYLAPPLMAVAELVKKVGVERNVQPHFELLGKGTDFRAGILSGIYGGSRHEKSDSFKDVELLLRNGIIPSNPDKDLLVWLMDNASNFDYGSKLVEYIFALSRIDLIPRTRIVDRYQILSQFRAIHSARVQYPNYKKRVGILRKRKDARE